MTTLPPTDNPPPTCMTPYMLAVRVWRCEQQGLRLGSRAHTSSKRSKPARSHRGPIYTHTRLTLKASIISCCISDQNAARCSLEELSGGDSDEVFFKKEELISGFGDFADVCDLNSGEPFA